MFEFGLFRWTGRLTYRLAGSWISAMLPARTISGAMQAMLLDFMLGMLSLSEEKRRPLEL